MSPKRAKKAAKRRAAPKKAAKKRATAKSARRGKKPAPRRSSAKPARRAATKPARRAAAKSAGRKVVRKKVAKRAGKKVARTAPRRPAKRKKATRRSSAKLRLVPGRAGRSRAGHAAKKPASPRHRPFGGALAGASAKDLALFDMVRARVGIQAAIQGMTAASAEMPVAEGKWNARQIVLHLHYWDREMLPHVEPAWRENRRPPHTKQDILAENETSQHELGGHDWDEAVRLMHHSRELILDALQSLPEEPAEMWSSEHALGWLIRVFTHHDRHHASVLKESRTRGEGPGGQEKDHP